MNSDAIQRFFVTLRDANPQPASELEYSSVFELLAAVLLSAQATDVSVNKATRRLFPVANTPAKIVALGVEGDRKEPARRLVDAHVGGLRRQQHGRQQLEHRAVFQLGGGLRIGITQRDKETLDRVGVHLQGLRKPSLEGNSSVQRV
jgi:hypothetical protein